ncbi:MAG: trehalose-6-phosphate synthase [Acetobacteraceae bacterium]|nr:trehalose-6-phosphate synthase [Acetobacteraceae bacterium]
MARLVIVSNRVPAPRERGNLAGGLAVALRDAIQGRETLWFGWSGETVEGETPEEARTTQIKRLTFATLDLAAADFQGFYQGFSNRMLWPLLHYRMGLAEFSRADLEAYRAVNEAFARALVPLLQPDDCIWVHDYHLIPLGASLRRRHVQARIGFFLHVPFPPPELFDCLPRAEELLRDFGAYDVIGMQVEEDARHLNAMLEPLGLPARAEAFPIGINPDTFATAAQKAEAGPEVARLKQSLGGRALIIGVDRLDYSKGLPQRFRGLAQLLKRFPEHRKQVTMIQIAPVSRGEVTEYRNLRKELDELAGRINGEHAEFDWVPLRYLTRGVARNTLAGLYRQARVGLVTPLRDGMNLVAKEYVAAQNAEDPGVLVLSKFAGAARELEGAILVNPYDPDETAEALHQALNMGADERRARWQGMADELQRHTAKIWARRFLHELGQRPARAA